MRHYYAFPSQEGFDVVTDDITRVEAGAPVTTYTAASLEEAIKQQAGMNRRGHRTFKVVVLPRADNARIGDVFSDTGRLAVRMAVVGRYRSLCDAEMCALAYVSDRFRAWVVKRQSHGWRIVREVGVPTC